MLHGFAPLPRIEVKQLTVYLLGIEIKNIFDSGRGRISAAEPRKGYDVQPLLENLQAAEKLATAVFHTLKAKGLLKLDVVVD